MPNSRIAGFYNLSLGERRTKVAEAAGLELPDLSAYWTSGGIDPPAPDPMIKKLVGTHTPPLGIGLNSPVNGRHLVFATAGEEPSVAPGGAFLAQTVPAR